MNKYSQHYFNNYSSKLAETEPKEKRKAEDILPMEGFIPAVQDYVLPYMGANRAGRAKAMALASGTEEEDIPLSTKHPLTYGLLAGTGAALGGGLAAVATAIGINAANKLNLIKIQDNSNLLGAGTFGVGALTAVGLAVAAQIKARNNLKRISKEYDSTNSINPKTPSIGSKYLANSGFAEKGEMDAYRYMSGKTDSKPEIGVAASLASIPHPYTFYSTPALGFLSKQQAINQQKEDNR